MARREEKEGEEKKVYRYSLCVSVKCKTLMITCEEVCVRF